MPLTSGTRLGSCEIIALVGSGGMGEVYRARDTKLGREVAVKVLPLAFVADPDRLARFEREAKALAALNHPHIAQVYGLEESGGTQFLVMELVAGETLAARLARGPIPIDEAIAMAGQIAAALEDAHERGIVHRDLKPANVALTRDGGHPETGSDIFILPLEGNRKPIPFLVTPLNERSPEFSPDGHWIAYESDETGHFEVFVAPYPGPGPKWQISDGGSVLPAWRRDGREIVY